MVFLFSAIHAQGKKTGSKKAITKYPESFTISRADFDNFFNYKNNDVLNTPANKYIDKSVLLLHTNNGDMQFLKLKLSYFPKALLMIQVNGIHSTQVFLLSDDKSLSYKGKVDKDVVTLAKCRQDEIVSE